MFTGILNGIVNGTEQIVFDYEVTGSAVSSISTGNILNGNQDGVYTIIVRVLPGIPNGSPPNMYTAMTVNGDNGNNYGYLGFNCNGSTVSNASGTAQPNILLTSNGLNNTQNGQSFGFSVSKLYAVSGAARLMYMIEEGDGGYPNGSSVYSTNAYGWVWNNTTDNINNLTIFAYYPGTGVVTNGFGVGTRIIILKNSASSITGISLGTPAGNISSPYIVNTLTRVNSIRVGQATNQVNFTNLNGDQDVIYLLSWRTKGGGASGAHSLRFNNDSGANYGEQYLVGTGGSATGGKNSSVTSIRMAYAAGANTYYAGNALIYAKSGWQRGVIVEETDNISGTSVPTINIDTQVWNNTSSVITSINITDPNSGSQILAGSQFDLYALRPSLIASYLIVAGGGGGGNYTPGQFYGGGGGAGGFLSGSTYLVSGQSYAVTVGAGGNGGIQSGAGPTNGGNSVFNGLTAIGGGAGGTNSNGAAGGSGGGAGGENFGTSGGAGTAGQGFAGGNSTVANYTTGAGGGAGSVGANGNASDWANGGLGLPSSISGTLKFYAGGGGSGPAADGISQGIGGSGVGGNAAVGATVAQPGAANTGSGGGGGNSPNGNGGAGAAGVVIISYPVSAVKVPGTGGTITTANGQIIHTFTSSGTFVAPVLR